MTRATDRLTHGALDPLADRNMRWDEVRRRLASMGSSPADEGARLSPYIAISRQAGAGGEALAAWLGSKIGWRVFDRELLDFLATQCRLDRSSLELLDETRVSWFDESVLNLVQPRLISQDDYVRRLVKLLVVALLEGPAIVVGRGAQAVLPRQRGLAVRVVAEEADRVARVREARGLDEKAARTWVAETDAARREFVRRHFHTDPTDPLQYDLVVNTSRLGVAGAGEAALAAATARQLLAT